MSDLFYIDTQPHPIPFENSINLNNFICCDEDRQIVADLITQLRPLSAPMIDDEFQSNHCSNRSHRGGCQNPNCQSVLNFIWNHRKGQYGLVKVRNIRTYFCSLPCAQLGGYQFEDIKLGVHLTIPKAYREIIHYLQNEFCCQLHQFKFYESICVLNFFAQKGKMYKKDLVPHWDQIEVVLRKLNLPRLTELLFHNNLKRQLDDQVSEQLTKKAKCDSNVQ